MYTQIELRKARDFVIVVTQKNNRMVLLSPGLFSLNRLLYKDAVGYPSETKLPDPLPFLVCSSTISHKII